MKHYYKILFNPQKLILFLLLLIPGVLSAGFVSGPSSVSCGSSGVYSFIVFDPNINNPFIDCGVPFWQVTRPDGTSYSASGWGISVNWGNQPGVGTVIVNAFCYDRYGRFIYESGGMNVSVGSGSLPTPTLSGPSSLCNNASGTYSASSSGAASYTFTVPSGWKINGSSVTSLTTTSSSVSVTAPASGSSTGSVRVRANASGGGCQGNSAFATRSVRYGAQSPSISGPTFVRQFEDAIYSVNGSGFSNFNWTFPQDWINFGPTNQSSINVLPLISSGTVRVTATNCGATVSSSLFVRLDDSGPLIPYELEVNANPEGISLSTYPNPTTSVLNIETTGFAEQARVEILNQNRETILSQKMEGNTTQLNLSQLTNGTYFLIYDNGKKKEVRRILVQH